MRLSRSTAMILVAVFIAVPALAAAQEPVRDFSQLNTRLKPGDTVWVTDSQGREIKGKITNLSSGSLALKAKGAPILSATDVSTIQLRDRDSLKNGTLIGLGVGAGLGLAGCISIAGEEDAGAWCAMGMLFYAGVGAGLGAVIDAMIPGKKLVVYRAAGLAGAPPARVSFAPVITPRAKGIAVSFAF